MEQTTCQKISALETEYLYKGSRVDGMELKPETIPCFMTTAFNMDDLEDVNRIYAEHGYTYVRTRNPNRDVLGEIVSYLEEGVKTDIFASGMGAITTTLLTVLSPKDHILCNRNVYGESFHVMDELMAKMGVEVTFVPFEDLDAVRRAIKKNTRLLYTEVVSNPTLRIADIQSIALIAHDVGALLMVDNTFTTPFAIRPLKLGADIVVNSLTKFLNGHSDAIGGAVTCRDAGLIDRIHHMAMLCGTSGDPFNAWLITRGIYTAAVRIPRQMETAAKLAAALEKHPMVLGVNHPSLKSHPQWELSQRMGKNGLECPILSIYLPEAPEKISEFMRKLRFAKYAPTLGGLRTTLSHPVTSSHPNIPDEVRREMGITPGMLRISVGTENADDLIWDFTQALSIFRNI